MRSSLAGARPRASAARPSHNSSSNMNWALRSVQLSNSTWGTRVPESRQPQVRSPGDSTAIARPYFPYPTPFGLNGRGCGLGVSRAPLGGSSAQLGWRTTAWKEAPSTVGGAGGRGRFPRAQLCPPSPSTPATTSMSPLSCPLSEVMYLESGQN